MSGERNGSIYPLPRRLRRQLIETLPKVINSLPSSRGLRPRSQYAALSTAHYSIPNAHTRELLKHPTQPRHTTPRNQLIRRSFKAITLHDTKRMKRGPKFRHQSEKSLRAIDLPRTRVIPVLPSRPIFRRYVGRSPHLSVAHRVSSRPVQRCGALLPRNTMTPDEHYPQECIVQHCSTLLHMG